MFGIGIPELILIMVLALIVIGPEKLPDIAKTLGKAMSEFKNVVDGVKTSIEEEQRNIEKDINNKPDKAYAMSLGDKEEELKRDYEEALAEEDESEKKAGKSSRAKTQVKKAKASGDSEKPKKTRKRVVKKEVVKEA